MRTILVDAVDAFVVENRDGTFEILKPMHEMLEEFPNKKSFSRELMTNNPRNLG